MYFRPSLAVFSVFFKTIVLFFLLFSLNCRCNHHNDTDSAVRKCERMHHTLALSFPLMIKGTMREGSSCFLADKSYFKNPLVPQCGIIITSCLSIQYPAFDFSVFLAFSSEVSLELPHEVERKSFIFFKCRQWRCGILKAALKPLLKFLH